MAVENRMVTYRQFHGEIPINYIGKELREILKYEKNDFKVLTGYGSKSGVSLSKNVAIKSLVNLKKEGKILGFLPGEVKYDIFNYYEDKMNFLNRIKKDSDFGNEGIIYVFLKK